MRIQTIGKIGKRTTYLLGVVVATMVGGLATVLVSAAIPDSSGVIHGCYSSLGTLRVIDSPSQTCTGLETAISWDQNAGTPTSAFLPIQQGDVLNSVQLAYRDLSGTDVSDVIFNNNNFTGSDMTGITLDDAEINNGYGDRANFSGLDFTPIGAFTTPGFSKSNFSDTVWTGMNIDSCSGPQFVIAYDSNLSGAQFDGTTLACADFRESDLSNINFAGASLSHVDLRATTMTGANITGVTWNDVTCPDHTNSDNNGNTCAGHL